MKREECKQCDNYDSILCTRCNGYTYFNQKKDCGNCKYINIKKGEEPCESCRCFDKWEFSDQNHLTTQKTLF